MRNQVFSLIILSAGLAGRLTAQHSVDFQRDVQPIFNDNCIACHRGAGAPAGLQLDTAAGVLKGSTARAVVVPGDAQKSILAQRISDTTGNQMPLGGSLSKEQIALIVDWINQGAKADVRQGQATGAAAAPKQKNPPPAISTVTTAGQERAMLDFYCVVCHQGAAAPKGLKLDQLDPADVAKNAETWEKVVHKVRAGMMPPSGFPRPERPTFESMIVIWKTSLTSMPW
jgi:mono/diheme cytochrome c family protein